MSGPNNLLFRDVPVTLASSVPQLAVGWNPQRQYLMVQNTGTGALSIGYNGSSSARAGTGPSLDPATAAGGQGGSWEFVGPIPMNAVYLYSASGTTAVVVEAT